MQLKYLLLILLIIILIGAGGAYWYFFMMAGTNDPIVLPGTPEGNGFVPLPRTVTPTTAPLITSTSTTTDDSATTTTSSAPLPKLRLLSGSPVGGFGASTTPANLKTAESAYTAVRWVDRGRGNIYEARSNTSDIVTLSNTVVPRIYESLWNKNLTAFIGWIFPAEVPNPLSVYAELQKGSASSSTPFSLKGKNLPENLITYAVSPKKDRIFMLFNENGSGVGYTATFSGQSLTKIFETPLTQLTVEWPEDSIIAITTRASALQNGFLYFVNPTTGAWKKILGPLRGLTTKTSHDGQVVFASSIIGDASTLKTSLYLVSKGQSSETGILTLADKCTWGNFYKEVIYCGVPSQLPRGTYPNDWYTGTMSFTDKIWQLNAKTGELKMVSALIDQSDRLIDAYKLDVDQNDNFLFFINKNDLSLWSLDLVR